ncbi:MAG: hypothetical protein JWN76_2083 [Chitinophagaceae bacterium]|nr:hypothetical protein [Chitinophagaceae bacterium]
MKKTGINMRAIIALAAGAVFSILPSELVKANRAIHNSSFEKTYLSATVPAGDTTTEAATTFNNGNAVSKKVNDKPVKTCKKSGCDIYAEVSKSDQTMNVYVSGELRYTFAVSTGRPGHPTPNLDLRPVGPLKKKYTSTKYPEGDYQGLGNMPYCVFLADGYAIHGTTPGSFKKLGTPASHGCVRLHPEDAKLFYELVGDIGLENTWVTVH